MERHLTRFRCFTSVDEAWADAERDFEENQRHMPGIPWRPTVKSTRGVELVHTCERSDWALWSDYQVTTVHGLKERVSGLSADAVKLISLVRGSDSGPPSVGWSYLAGVLSIVERGDLYRDPPDGSVYQGRRIERVTVRLADMTIPLYLTTRGYSEGYHCLVSFSEEGALEHARGLGGGDIRPVAEPAEPVVEATREDLLVERGKLVERLLEIDRAIGTSHPGELPRSSPR